MNAQHIEQTDKTKIKNTKGAQKCTDDDHYFISDPVKIFIPKGSHFLSFFIMDTPVLRTDLTIDRIREIIA